MNITVFFTNNVNIKITDLTNENIDAIKKWMNNKEPCITVNTFGNGKKESIILRKEQILFIKIEEK